MKTRGGERPILAMALLGLAMLLLATGSPSAQTRAQGLRLDQVAPPSATIGTEGVTITLAGQGFRIGDRLVSRSSSVEVLSYTVVAATTSVATLRILPTAQPGPVRLDIVGFDQSTSRQIPPPPPILLYPSGGLAAPFAIRDAAVISPMSGALLTFGEPVFVRGLLSTSGTGTVIGTFLLDGVPFDQFTVLVTGGEPVAVEAKVPVPDTYAGTHDLQLQVVYPQRFLSGATRIIGAADARSSLKLILPEDGSVGLPTSHFRWTLVPGAQGYEILWQKDGCASPQAFSADGETWAPNGTELALMGTGAGRWTVRPLLAGGVTGVPAPWRRLALVEGSVRLALAPPEAGALAGSVRLAWTGGAEGMVYLLEFYSPETAATPLFRAMTRKREYTLKPLAAPGPLEVSVTPLSESGAPLGESVRERITPGRTTSMVMPESSVQFAAAPAILQGTTPADGATGVGPQPALGARWSGSVPADEVVILIDNMDVSAMAALSPGMFSYTPTLPLGEGPHTVRLSLGGADYQWTFTVKAATGLATGARAKPGEAAEKPGLDKGSGASGSWTAAVAGTFTEISGSRPDQTDTFRLTLTSQSDLGSDGWFFKDSLDASFRHDFPEPSLTVNESRNWLLKGGYKGQAWSWSAQAGYAPASFLGGAQLVSPGLSRGGAEAQVASPVGTLDLYGSFDNNVPGLASGSGAGEVRVLAAGYTLPLADKRFSVRLLGLWTDQDSTQTLKGGAGRVFGILARLDFDPRFRMLIEAAQGRNDPEGADAYQGNGYRLGIEGTVSGTSYALNLRSVSPTFANPANPGYTPCGVSDRTGADIRVSRAFGRLSTALALAYTETGVDGTVPASSDGRQTNGTLTLSYAPSQTVVLSAALNGTWTRQAAVKSSQLPGMDQNQYAVTLSAVERFGKLGFSQTYSGQELRDDLNPLTRNTVNTFVMTLGGEVAPGFGLAATGAFTRSQAAAPAGRTDLAVISLAPYWLLPDLHLTITPRISYTRNLNDAGTVDSHAEQYQLSFSWNPAWWHSFLALQGSAEYDRNANAITPLPIVSEYRYTLSLVCRWGSGSGTLNSRYAQGAQAPFLSPMPNAQIGSGMGAGI